MNKEGLNLSNVFKNQNEAGPATNGDINNREDVNLLVKTFYTKVRADEHIGPIFNEIISDWDHHLELLTDFWETNLFFVQKYRGNPVQAHIGVDQSIAHEITNEHFGTWLRLWVNTVDELFEGKKATLAKERARNMSGVLFMRIFQSRKR